MVANKASVPMDSASLKLGLLMEAAQSHQKLAESAVEKLTAHTEGLEAMFQDQVRHVMREELTALRAETHGAATALRTLKRAANARTTFWVFGITAIAVAIALLVAWWVLPTPVEIAALRRERDELPSNVAVLDERGARADLRVCGAGRLCVRVDLKAPRYGEHFDYLVIKGY